MEQDYEQALGWYLRAEELGFTGGYFSRIGYMYENGMGCKKNIEKAIEYYKKGSECGDNGSALNFARLVGSTCFWR